MNSMEYSENHDSVRESGLYHRKRSAKAFRSRKDRRRYWILLLSLFSIGIIASMGLIFYDNPIPVDSPSFIPVTRRRITALIAMIIAAICHSLATLAFQSITNNKIITPSLLGFEALYGLIQTSTIFFLGSAALITFSGPGAFGLQVLLMVSLSLILYGWLLLGKFGNLQLMLLVGIIIGSGLNSISTFMRRVLAPSEFDILQARLFGSVNNADPEYFPTVIPLVLIVAFLLMAFSNRLNVISLGRDVSSTLGMRHKMSLVYVLILVAILMAITTALIGPLTFFGFLVATLTYQAAPTYDHKYMFPMSLAIGFVVLTGAYFLMTHVVPAQGVVAVIIELAGGLIFLIVILRKRKL